MSKNSGSATPSGPKGASPTAIPATSNGMAEDQPRFRQNPAIRTAMITEVPMSTTSAFTMAA